MKSKQINISFLRLFTLTLLIVGLSAKSFAQTQAGWYTATSHKTEKNQKDKKEHETKITADHDSILSTPSVRLITHFQLDLPTVLTVQVPRTIVRALYHEKHIIWARSVYQTILQHHIMAPNAPPTLSV